MPLQQCLFGIEYISGICGLKMYIVNPSSLDKDSLFETNGVIANYLIKNGIPLLSRKEAEGIWIFAKTENLQKALDKMPFYYKVSKFLK
jgi:hypothetical protein